jgi:hypothetical protein
VTPRTASAARRRASRPAGSSNASSNRSRAGDGFAGRPELLDPNHIERTILDLLTNPDGQRLWSVEEIGREIENLVKAKDALAALYRAGLIHRTSDNFIFATRAATRASELRI